MMHSLLDLFAGKESKGGDTPRRHIFGTRRHNANRKIAEAATRHKKGETAPLYVTYMGENFWRINDRPILSQGMLRSDIEIYDIINEQMRERLRPGKPKALFPTVEPSVV